MSFRLKTHIIDILLSFYCYFNFNKLKLIFMTVIKIEVKIKFLVMSA